jgi:hypothetical protein
MAFKANKSKLDLINQGRWVQYDEDTRFKIARLDNESYQVGLERHRRALKRIEDGKVGVESVEQTIVEAQADLLAKYVLLDWDGVIDADTGKPLPYSQDIARQNLRYDSGLFTWVIEKASEQAAYMVEDVEETLGKSETPSATK